MMRRLLTIACIAGLLSGSSSPAWALTGSSARVSFVEPTPKAEQIVNGPVNIRVQAEGSSGFLLGRTDVKSIKVTITPLQVPGAKILSPSQEGAVLEFTWNAAYNGGYDLQASATLDNGDVITATPVKNVLVNNPPATPSKPTAGVEGSTVVVRWSANPEPDILSYELSRSVEGAPFTQVADIDAGKTLSFTDSQAPVDKPVKYRVVAVRRSAYVGKVLESSPADSATITVPAAAPPATDAAGNPIPAPATVDPALAPGVAPLPPAPAAAPAAPTTTADPFPTRKGAPPPVFEARPSEISFAEGLPFDETPPPRKFDTGQDGAQDVAAPAGLTNAFVATNPVLFMIMGTILLLATFLLAKKSRRLLHTDADGVVTDDFLAGMDFSGLGDIQLPDKEIAYPDFHAFRS